MGSRFKVTDLELRDREAFFYLNCHHFKEWIRTDVGSHIGNDVDPQGILSDDTYIKVKTIHSKLLRSMFEEQQD